MYEEDELNNYIFIIIIQPYGNCKISSDILVRRSAHKIVFVERRTSDMPHIEGNDDGHGNGGRGTISRLNGSGVFDGSEIGFGMKGQSNSNIQIYREQHRQETHI